MVDNNSDTTGLFPSNPCLLEFGKGESAALTNFAVVADSLRANGRAKEGKWANAKGGSLGLASGPSAELAARLVEPGADAALPVLPEMVGGEDY